MVVVDVVVVEKTGSLDGNSSIQDTKKLVGVVVVVAEPRDSKSYNFSLKVERGSIENKMKGIMYSHFAYYSNCSYYSKMETSPGSVATFHTPGSRGRNIQATRCVLGGKSRVKAVTLFLIPPFRKTPSKVVAAFQTPGGECGRNIQATRCVLGGSSISLV